MIKLNIASPGMVNVNLEVDRVGIKLVEGNVEVLPKHINFISLIKNGYVKYNDQQVDIKDGVVHLENDELYITYFE